MENNTDEIVRALRSYARNAQENNEIYTMQDLDVAANLIESLQSQLAESQRRERAAAEERDTMMRRHSNQVEVIRQRIDAGGLSCEESWLLRELMFETRYDRRGPQAGEGEAE